MLEGRPHVRLTELAKKLTTAQNEVDRSAAYFEAIYRIVLWRELYNRHKFHLPQQNLWEDIVEITECNPRLAHEVESFVRQAFEADTNSIRAYKFEPPSGVLQVVVEPRNAQVGIRPPGDLEIEIKAGPYYHRLPFTAESLKAAIEILKAIKAPAEKSA